MLSLHGDREIKDCPLMACHDMGFHEISGEGKQRVVSWVIDPLICTQARAPMIK